MKPSLSASRDQAWVLGILSLMGVALVLISTSRYGVGLSPDSTMYLSAARNLMDGRGLTVFDGSPYVAWPPLFPALLSALGRMGVDPLDGARWLNALTFGALVFVSGRTLREGLRSRPLAGLGAAFVALSIPLIDAAKMAWTEPLFALLTVLFLIDLTEYLGRREPRLLVRLSALTALACLQRYAGVTLILTGQALILLIAANTPVVKRLKQAAGFGFLSALPVGLWMLRNVALTATPSGSRSASAATLLQNVTAALDVLTVWFLPHPIPLPVRVAGVAVFASGAIWVTLKTRERRSAHALSAAVFVLTYVPFLIAMAAGVAFDAISDRLLTPVCVPLTLLAFIGVEKTLEMQPRWGPWKHRLTVGLCLVWLAYPLARVVKNVPTYARTGAGGYTTTAWKESPLLEWVRAHRGEPIYTNAPDAVYILTGLVVRSSPTRDRDLHTFRDILKVPEGGGYLVWFSLLKHSYIYDLEYVKTAFDMELEISLRDGEVYFFK